MADLWDRRDKETPKAWAAFVAFRDLPPKERSLEAAWRSLLDPETRKNAEKRRAKSPANWTEWAFNHDWKTRAAAFDREQDRKKRDLFDQAQREELERFRVQFRRDKENFARAARAAMKKALIALDKADTETITLKDAIGLLEAARRAIKDANEYEMVDLGLDLLMEVLNERDNGTDTDEDREED